MPNVVVVTVSARGLGASVEAAKANALKRLEEANTEIQAGRYPVDPGVEFFFRDPGGGGGPCEPLYISEPILVSGNDLPEAVARPKDDDSND